MTRGSAALAAERDRMISEEVEAAFMARMTDPGCHIDVTPPTVNEPLPPEVAYHGEPDQR